MKVYMKLEFLDGTKGSNEPDVFFFKNGKFQTPWNSTDQEPILPFRYVNKETGEVVNIDGLTWRQINEKIAGYVLQLSRREKLDAI
jgi:hypothetical protein